MGLMNQLEKYEIEIKEIYVDWKMQELGISLFKEYLHKKMRDQEIYLLTQNLIEEFLFIWVNKKRRYVTIKEA